MRTTVDAYLVVSWTLGIGISVEVGGDWLFGTEARSVGQRVSCCKSCTWIVCTRAMT